MLTPSAELGLQLSQPMFAPQVLALVVLMVVTACALSGRRINASNSLRFFLIASQLLVRSAHRLVRFTILAQGRVNYGIKNLFVTLIAVPPAPAEPVQPIPMTALN